MTATLVKFTIYRPGPLGDTIPDSGSIECKPTLKRHVEGATPPDMIVLPARFSAKLGAALYDDDGTTVLQPATPGVAWAMLGPTDAGPYAGLWGWTIIGRGVSSSLKGTYLVPTDAGTVDFGDLVAVDPDSFTPLPEPVPAWAAPVAALDARLDAQEAESATFGDIVTHDASEFTTDAELAAEALVREAEDLALQADIDAEALLARNANNLTSGTVADARLPARLSDATLSATYELKHTVVMSGAFASLQAAIDATPDGWNLYVPKADYNVATTLTSSGKSIRIISNGAKLIQTADTTVLRLEGGFDPTIYSISVLDTTATVTVDGHTRLATGLTLNATPPWVRGDLVKLVSDDVIPGGRPGSGGTDSRQGQFFHVWSVTGTAVVLLGRPRETMTTSPRVCRLTDHQIEVSGLRFDTTDYTNFNASAFVIREAYRPKVDVEFAHMGGACVSSVSNYGGKIRAVTKGAQNETGAGHFGYGVIDQQGEFNDYEVHAAAVRHAYTDDSAHIAAASTTIRGFGRSYGNEVTGVAHGTTSSAWDTHACSRNTIFRDTKSVDCLNAHGLRGIENKIYNSTVDFCDQVLWVFSEDDAAYNTQSWGHEIDGITAKNMRAGGLVPILFELNLTGLAAGTRETRLTRVRNVSIDGIRMDAAYVKNATVRFRDMGVSAAATVANGTSVFHTKNADIDTRRIRADYKLNTAGTTLNFWYAETASIISGDNAQWVYNSGLESRIQRIITTDSVSTAYNLKDVEVSFKPSATHSLGSSASRFDYLALNTGDNSAWLTSTDSAIAGGAIAAQIVLSSRARVHLQANPSDGARTMAKLGNGNFKGQLLTITHTGSSNTVTIGHGNVTYNTTNLGAADRVLSAGQESTWRWDGTSWVEQPPVRLPLFARRTSNATPVNNSAVLVTDSVLSLTLEPNSVYEFSGQIYYDASTAGDIKLGWVVPSGATGTWTQNGLITTTASASSSIGRAQLDISATGGSGGNGVGTGLCSLPVGTVITGSSGGTFALRFAQQAADPTDTTLRAGSTLVARKVA